MRVLIDWSVSMKKCISSIFLSGSRKNFRQYCKPSTTSRVLITVSNSPNFPRVWMRLRKHGKSPLLHNCLIAVIPMEPAGKASSFYIYKQTRLMGQYNGKWHISLVYVSNPVDNTNYLPDFLCGRWSYGVVLYEIFTMGRYFMKSELLFVWNLTTVVQRLDTVLSTG